MSSQIVGKELFSRECINTETSLFYLKPSSYIWLRILDETAFGEVDIHLLKTCCSR